MSASSDELDTKGMIFVDDDAESSWYDATHVRSIQEGIDNASSGDTVFVYNGTYYENVIVNKTIELIGENRNSTIIDGGSMNNVFNISANLVTINGFRLENGNYGVYFNNSNDSLIDNCNCSNNEEGIYFTQSCYNFISNISFNNTTTILRISEHSNNNYIYNCNSPSVSNSYIGILNSDNNIISKSTCGGIEIGESQNNTVTRCYYAYTWIGESINNYVIDNVVPNSIIHLGDGAYYNNIINNTCYEISLGFDASNNLICNNLVSNGPYGISLGGGPPSDVRPSYNSIFNNTLINCSFGIRLDNHANHNHVTNNTIINGINGIYLYSSNNIISNNSVSNNTGDGMVLDTNCNNTLISNNNFYSNVGDGIKVINSYNTTLLGNLISNNSENGIHCKTNCMNTSIDGNIVKNSNNSGIDIEIDCENNIIVNNTLNNNGLFGLAASSDFNLVYHNNFMDNNVNAWPGLYYWDNGYPSGGNYWDDYEGSDQDGDGIGDTPYFMAIGGGYVNDSYPFIEENGWLKTINVNQSTYDRGFPIRHAVDGDWAAAQSFIPSNGSVTRADLYLRRFGTPEFNLTVELRKNHPQGLLLDSIVFSSENVSANWEWLNGDFNDVTVTNETNCFIVIPPSPSGVTNSFGYEWGYVFGNQYDDGSFWFTRDGGDLWRDLPTMYEFSFRTYGYNL